MRHHNANRKLGRKKNQRVALKRSLLRSLALRGRIQTTEARAKEIRPLMEKLVTRGKNPTLANRRMLISAVGDAGAVNKIIAAADTHKERAGGYLRITKLVQRRGDAAKMALIEFV
ncbi:50S ribosomal protein L17 [Candidatus Adlerbacteria bacterium RIFCSPHIGHO2_12_FULL_53_18]|uniref:50S ribosomal protein L17 n=1 Tax=Candidatus Adlerbacteria bacterium RIFCSPHIGHO2_12_FULL_53_18 TaxID=1797242 RepID=A0A1F4XTV9_9BACT|nr:MAG: 50S ribosomal protein L17 [Candidatus Adlerbacteria bacterium RIFCSPHIGHO2_12_FULL_53_18]